MVADILLVNRPDMVLDISPENCLGLPLVNRPDMLPLLRPEIPPVNHPDLPLLLRETAAVLPGHSTQDQSPSPDS